MLYSAYKAAKVHALPSWYELPGLVSLEAAWFGCNVVASDWGTIWEYLGEEAYYCEPTRPDTIRDAVIRALRDPPNPRARARAESLSWDTAARVIARIYRSLLDERGRKKKRKKAPGLPILRAQQAKRETLRHQIRGQALAVLSQDPAAAINLAHQVLEHFPQDAVAHFIYGVAQLSFGRYGESEAHLSRAIELTPTVDMSAYLYLALTRVQQGNGAGARAVLYQALDIHPFESEETRALVEEYLELAQRVGTQPRLKNTLRLVDSARETP
jgi:tetratricopeptide (TPR) repeat protein